MTAPAESALYEGTLTHARFGPVRHAFTYEVLMAWLDLAELPGALDAHPLWSARHVAPMRFARRDFHGDPGVPLDQAVRDTIDQQIGRRPQGPIRLLAHLRTWGWSFNPIAFYVAYATDGTTIEAVLAEVTNTPWHERHAYVIPVDGPELAPTRFPKAMHVSPFLDMDLDHTLSFDAPGRDRWTIDMDDHRGGTRVFAARLDLHRRPLDRPTMGRMLRRHPAPAIGVSAGIYREALKLRWKHAPFRRHPAKVGRSRATASAVSPAAASPAAPEFQTVPTPTTRSTS